MIESLQLCIVLNQLGAGFGNAATAEQQLRVAGRPHHVADPDGLLGLDPLAGTPIRLTLARVSQRYPNGRWVLLLPRPGRLSGLSGPASTTALALDAGAIVIQLDGGLAWLPRPVGPAMQWLLVPAERPQAPADVATATRALAETVLAVEQAIGSLDQIDPADQLPFDRGNITLGRGFDARNQTLLDRAIRLHDACLAGLAASRHMLHSHDVLTREHALHELDDACLTAMSSAVSWPHSSAGRSL